MPPPRRESRSSPGGPGAPNCSSDWGSSWVAFRRIDAIMASAPNRSPQFDSFRVNSSVYALPRFKSERKSEPGRFHSAGSTSGESTNVRKLGIVGGASWSSTALYYEHINKGVAQRLGGLHSARLVLESLDMEDD